MVEICLFPLTRLIAYTTACCYQRAHKKVATAQAVILLLLVKHMAV